MTELCRDFGISRKTGHKWVARHAAGGMKGLEAYSRAPKSVTCRTTDELERLICTEKRLRSTWGPKKIRQVLMTKYGVESPPAVSTVGEVLKRHGPRRGLVGRQSQITDIDAVSPDDSHSPMARPLHPPEPGEVGLGGWYLGEKSFGDKVLEAIKTPFGADRKKGSVGGDAARAHDEAAAQWLVTASNVCYLGPQSG